MDASFCVAALEEALARYGKPEIFNTDQGSQFTSADFTGVLIEADVRISMDGRGRWMDNVFIERVSRSLKYEDVYLKATPTVATRKPASAIGSFSTTSNAFIKRLAIARRWPSGANGRRPRPMDMWTTQTR